ncbi:RHS repeat-associated core domain-containing protein [Microcoleus sp. CAWBG58]|uniref:RHS repeat domain-containing protein n=1 Tax=Microcoleus sp. CAWBG58 TaxID=2841651 RepID=UPI0025D4B671|nr:RHS repeat-associated core domain-containing protein [Microcoleus sp. CAWBG58]
MNALKTISTDEKFPDSTCQKSQGKKITYTYDSMNRRVARTDENGTTQYLYGNPNHPFQLAAVCPPSGSLSRYHYDDFGLLFALERDNKWYYITTDQLGTPRVVCDVNGEVVKVLEYDSFGQVIVDRNPEFELHISFAGGLIDVDTELVRFGFRDYDAVAGKWTAKDPMGFGGGDGNLYGYIVNEPVNLTDPSGLAPNSGPLPPPPRGQGNNNIQSHLPTPPTGQNNNNIQSHLPTPPTGQNNNNISSGRNLPKCGQDQIYEKLDKWLNVPTRSGYSNEPIRPISPISPSRGGLTSSQFGRHIPYLNIYFLLIRPMIFGPQVLGPSLPPPGYKEIEI